MANLIQIKRSETTATPGSLANGELAWAANGNILYIGDFGDGVVPGKTLIRVYSLAGDTVAELKDGTGLDTGGLSSGIYIYIYESPKERGVGKFTVIR